MAKKDYVVGTGNVFEDLGHPRPAEALAKAELARKIGALIEQRRLTQAAAAEVLQIDRNLGARAWAARGVFPGSTRAVPGVTRERRRDRREGTRQSNRPGPGHGRLSRQNGAASRAQCRRAS